MGMGDKETFPFAIRMAGKDFHMARAFCLESHHLSRDPCELLSGYTPCAVPEGGRLPPPVTFRRRRTVAPQVSYPTGSAGRKVPPERKGHKHELASLCMARAGPRRLAAHRSSFSPAPGPQARSSN